MSNPIFTVDPAALRCDGSESFTIMRRPRYRAEPFETYSEGMVKSIGDTSAIAETLRELHNEGAEAFVTYSRVDRSRKILHWDSRTMTRVSALACLVRDEGGHIQGFRGDLCYDGAQIALNDAPCLVVLHDCGSHLAFDTYSACALARTYGPSDRAKWFLGRPGWQWDYADDLRGKLIYTYTFAATTPEEVSQELPYLDVTDHAHFTLP